MVTMERVLLSWKKNLDTETLSGLVADYRIEIFRNSNGELYVIEPATNSGFQINQDMTVITILSGVYDFKYYEEEPTLLPKDKDLKVLYKKLIKKEKINKDRLNNVMIFLEDVATRDLVENGK
jgi:hypothetical protein